MCVSAGEGDLDLFAFVFELERGKRNDYFEPAEVEGSEECPIGIVYFGSETLEYLIPIGVGLDVVDELDVPRLILNAPL